MDGDPPVKWGPRPRTLPSILVNPEMERMFVLSLAHVESAVGPRALDLTVRLDGEGWEGRRKSAPPLPPAWSRGIEIWLILPVAYACLKD